MNTCYRSKYEDGGMTSFVIATPEIAKREHAPAVTAASPKLRRGPFSTTMRTAHCKGRCPNRGYR